MTEFCAQLQEAIARAKEEAKATVASSESARQAAEVAQEASMVENRVLGSGLVSVRREH
jgi:hypothetical protein